MPGVGLGINGLFQKVTPFVAISRRRVHIMEFSRIQSMDRPTLEEASLLLTSAFGPGFDLERLRTLASDPNCFLAQVKLGERMAFVGMAFIGVQVEKKFAVYGAEAVQFLKTKRIGLLEGGATAPWARRRGIAQAAASELMSWLNEQRCEYIVASSWVHGTKNQSLGLLKRMGFLTLAEVSGQHYRHKNLKGSPCPVCGETCKCRAVLLFKKLESSQR